MKKSEKAPKTDQTPHPLSLRHRPRSSALLKASTPLVPRPDPAHAPEAYRNPKPTVTPDHLPEYDMTGLRVLRWDVGRRVTGPEVRPSHRLYECTCDCGVERLVRHSDLRSRRSVSCGCWSREQARHHQALRGWLQLAGVLLGDHPEIAHLRRVHARVLAEYGDNVVPEWKGPEGFDRFYLGMGPKPRICSALERRTIALPWGPANCVWDPDNDRGFHP